LLQKALNLFNAALVTPTYYVFFTSATIITSAILFQGFKGTPIGITTVIMGFLQICAGVILLQLSKSAKDVPDAAVFKGDLDQMREVAEQEQPETEPKADAIRAGASIVRRFSVTRKKMEQEEARRLRQDTLKDHLEPVAENEIVEWDGLRRRKTVIANPEPGSPVRRKTIHPPLGMSYFPDPNEEEQGERDQSQFLTSLRTRAKSIFHPNQPEPAVDDPDHPVKSPIHPVALTEISVHSSKPEPSSRPYGPGSLEEAQEHIYGYKLKDGRKPMPSPRSKPLPASPKPQASQSSLVPQPTQEARRQFSFTGVFHRNSRSPDPTFDRPSSSRSGIGSRQGGAANEQRRAMKNATEEERLGLVKGDSHAALLEHSHGSSPTRPTYQLSHSQSSSTASESHPFPDDDEKTPSASRFRDFHTASPQESDSDGDVKWQMTSPPPDNQQRSPPRPSSRRRPSPPQIYRQPKPPSATDHQTVPVLTPLPPAVATPGPLQQRAVAAPNPFPTFLTNQNRTPPNPSYLRSESGSSLTKTTSPEEYDTNPTRFDEQKRQMMAQQQQQQQQQQRRQQRQQRRKPGSDGDADAFV
jgi:magnesium transporter